MIAIVAVVVAIVLVMIPIPIPIPIPIVMFVPAVVMDVVVAAIVTGVIHDGAAIATLVSGVPSARTAIAVAGVQDVAVRIDDATVGIYGSAVPRSADDGIVREPLLLDVVVNDNRGCHGGGGQDDIARARRAVGRGRALEAGNHQKEQHDGKKNFRLGASRPKS
jgi:hypothetical protein